MVSTLPKLVSSPTTMVGITDGTKAGKSSDNRMERIEKLRGKMPKTMSISQVENNIRVENCIGFAQIPLGVAGPLAIHGTHQKGKFLAPLATLEATLVASCSRGCKAFQKTGIHAAALAEGVSRAPIFMFKTVDKAVSFYLRVPSLEAEFRVDSEKTSRFARLIHLTPHIIGTSVHVKFDYHCGDAAGQNMVTIATHAACMKFLKSSIARDAGIIDFQFEGNISSDKKLSWGNVTEPRGVSVISWAVLDNDTCQSVLGVTCARLQKGFRRAQDGAIRNGMIGNNVNTANIIAAMFIACGQDAASILESGWSQLTTELDDTTQQLTISIFFPSLLVGSVGGGTAYGTQREALELINCFGPGRKWALAETIAAFALALDVSTASAIANDTFAAGHQRFARL